MRINADFSKPVLSIPSEEDWLHSPEYGVDRRMLDRIGDEAARATSVVRYAPGSAFPVHEHAKGEEFLVLEGVFSDESGDFPAGTYVRNPPGSRHAPRSAGGCRILVKLRQFAACDVARVVIDTGDEAAWSRDDLSASLPLHAFGTEKVAMRRLAPGGSLEFDVGTGGLELFVVSGALDYAGKLLGAESWLRLPTGTHAGISTADDTLFWLKTGHLPADL